MFIRTALFAAFAVAVAACNPDQSTQSTASTQAAVSDCAASAHGTWREYSVDAATSGADCASATATIIVKDAAGHELLRESAPASQVMVLASAQDVAAMNAALHEWVTYDNHTMATTSALPEWPRGATQPQNGEFPFYQEENVTRESYNALRTRNVPLFCYVQGMESLGCYALENGALTKVGAQSFPG